MDPKNDLRLVLEDTEKKQNESNYRSDDGQCAYIWFMSW